MPEMQPATAAPTPMLFDAASAALDDMDYALGCECADPSLQIERWRQEAGTDAGGLKELNGQHSRDAKFGGNAQGGVLCGSSDLHRDVQGGGYNFITHTIHLDGVDHRPGAGFAVGCPCNEC